VGVVPTGPILAVSTGILLFLEDLKFSSKTNFFWGAKDEKESLTMSNTI
jgi:hypothetical protein